MAIQGRYDTIPGLVASGDLSAAQYKVVKMASTANAVIVCTAATDIAIGILQNKPTSGQAAEVACLGVAKAKFAASQVLTKPLLYPNTTGYLQGTTVYSKSIVAQIIQASNTTAGNIYPVLLK